MYKFILFAVFLNITYLSNAKAHDPPMQLFITDIQDTGTYTKPVIHVSYAAYPDNPVHAEQRVPSFGLETVYGIIYSYNAAIGSITRYGCFYGKMSGGNPEDACIRMHYPDEPYSNPNRDVTFAEANGYFIKRNGQHGTIISPWSYRPYQWSICVGSANIPWGLSATTSFAPALSNDCAVIPPKPVSCEVSSNNTIELDHGILDAKSLQATHSKTASLTIDCGYNTSMKLDFTEPTITLAKGLTSTLSLKVDGQDFSNGKTIVFQEEKQSRIDITSTLKAVGDIEPNTYSGSSVLIINIQ